MQEDILDYHENYKLLRDTDLFNSLDENILKDMIRECKLVFWKKTETINSDIGIKYLHIILDGRLKVTQIDPTTGRSILLFLLEKGDIFDIFSLLDGEEHTTFPIAIDDITALCIPIDRAREWIYEYHIFNKNFLPYLGKRMRELEAFGESMVFDDIATRLSKLILRHVNPKEKLSEHHSVRLINNLSHESLSEMIGSVRSVVSTQMKKLKNEEIILNKRGRLSVKNLEELIKKCDFIKKSKKL